MGAMRIYRDFHPQFRVAVLNLGLHLLWIPLHGGRGAGWPSRVSAGTFGLISVLSLILVSNRASAAIF